MTRFTGKGLRLPLTLDRTGLARVADHELLVQSIVTILSTCRGEREMRPEFGCDLYDLVFGNDDPATLGRIERDVHNALGRWEPRIEVLGVHAAIDPDKRDCVLVRIEYAERLTNERNNLIYPFYLQ